MNNQNPIPVNDPEDTEYFELLKSMSLTETVNNREIYRVRTAEEMGVIMNLRKRAFGGVV